MKSLEQLQEEMERARREYTGAEHHVLRARKALKTAKEEVRTKWLEMRDAERKFVDARDAGKKKGRPGIVVPGMGGFF